jgi:rhodanese-related sulfurtransferase
VVAAPEPDRLTMSVPTFQPGRLYDLHAAGQPVDLIDVRTPAEFRAAHIAFAHNVPLDRLDPEEVLRSGAGRGDEPLYVVCQSGGRGRLACERLIVAGLANVANVEGGTAACAAAGLPVVHGRTAVSLECQVRIAVGSLVLVGTALGWLVHPAAAGLAAFVGAGLVFSGVTDTCGMGLLLARMPWNRARGPADSCPAG